MCRSCAGIGPLFVGGDGIARCIDCDKKEARRAEFCGESWPEREIPKRVAVRLPAGGGARDPI